MRITVFGVVGNVGRRVVAEGLSRGHEVTAVVRNPAYVPQLPGGVRAHIGDAGKVEDVAKLSAGQDVVISATRSAPGSEHELPMTAKALLAGVARTGVRLLVSMLSGLASPGPRQDGGCRLCVPLQFCSPRLWRRTAILSAARQ